MSGLDTAWDDVKQQVRKHGHYFKDVSDTDVVDIYDVCELFPMNDNSGALMHAVKKILGGGGRGSKGQMQDVEEAIDTLTRWVEINKRKQDGT